MSTTRFSSRLCLIKGHRFLKKQYEIFLSLLIPQKRWNILFSSENDRFFQLAHHRAKSSAMFELYWLPVSTLSELRHHVLTSRAPFEPMEKCEMKFRLVSSNSRGLSLARAQVFCIRNWRYFKRGLFIYFVVTHETCFQSCPRTISQVKKVTFLLRNVSSDGSHIYLTILVLDVDWWHDAKPVIS